MVKKNSRIVIQNISTKESRESIDLNAALSTSFLKIQYSKEDNSINVLYMREHRNWTCNKKADKFYKTYAKLLIL